MHARWDINNPYYQDHVALRGGLFYLIDGFDVTIDNGALGYARAVYDDSVSKKFWVWRRIFMLQQQELEQLKVI